MKMLYCKKCGAAVISDETLLQSILDRLDDVQERALHAKSGSEKQILLHEAAEYKTMYKSMMHNITQREYAEAVVPYILREMLITVKGRKLLTDAEVEKIYADGKAAAKKVQEHTRKIEKEIYGDFEAACNRSKRDPTANAAIAEADRKPKRVRTQVWRAKE